MKLRILHLLDSFDEGGSERQALQLVRLLHQSGHYEVHLASLRSNGVMREEAEAIGLRDGIESYPLNSFYDLNAVRQLKRFARYVRDSRIDLIQTHDFYTNVFGMTGGYLAGVAARIASCRETDGMRTRNQQRVQKFVFRLAHAIVVNSESVRNKLSRVGVDDSKLNVVYNGLDLERVAAATSRANALETLGLKSLMRKRIVTIVANMRHEVKDHGMFLRAAERVSESVADAVFVLAGEGELKDSLERMAADLGLQDKAFFVGACRHLGQLLQVSDVCVLSSKAEGFSNSILEYMGAAKPVVATDVGGAREAIVEGETGFLVASGDHESMAARIGTLLQDPHRAEEMGKAGRAVVERKFSLDSELQTTEQVYARLLGAPREKETKQVQPDFSQNPNAVDQI